MSKKYLIFLLILMMFLFSVYNVNAFFFWSHEKWVIEGFNEINSPTTNLCRAYLNIVIDGDLSSDSGVIHYSDSGQTLFSYIYPHTLQGYNECLREAGSDVQIRCFCIGNYLHILQDSYSHNIGGLVEKYLRKYLGNNYLGHMTLERNYENIHKTIVSSTNPNLKSLVDQNDKRVLDSLFPEFGGNDKYLEVMKGMSGLNMKNDAQLIRQGYLGEGFYDYVYKDKTKLPLWAYWVTGLMSFLSFLIILLLLLFGKTKWKYLTIFVFFLAFLAVIVIFYSFNPPVPLIGGNIWDLTKMPLPTWKITTFIIEVPPRFGYLRVSEQDVKDYDSKIQKATNEFLQNPIPNIQDASGLTYQDKNGNIVIGPLTQAEKPFKYILLPIMAFNLLWTFVWLFMKSFGIKLKRRWYNPFSWI